MIQVRAPDGSIAQFPDGMGEAQIRAVMARHYGGPSPQTQRVQADAQKAVKDVGPVAAFLNGRTFNLAPQVFGAEAALDTAINNLGHTITGTPKPYGAGDMYRATTQAVQDEGNKYQAAHPLASLGLNLAGGVDNPINVKAGKLVAGAKSLPRAIATSAAVGAPIGAAYGAGGAPRGQRLAAAGQGAMVGAATGAAAPVLGAIARPVVRRVGGVAADIGRGARAAVLGADPHAPPTPAQTAAAAQRVQQIIAASRKAPGDLVSHPAVMAGKPITTAEAIGRQGVTQLAALARRGGATGDNLAPILADRAQQAPSRIQQDFSTAAGIHPEAASGDMDALIAKLQGRAKPLYDAALSSPDPVWNVDLARLAQRPAIKKAINAAGNSLLNAGQDPTAAGFHIDPDTGAFVLDQNLAKTTGQFPTAQTWDKVKKMVGALVQRDPVTGRVIRSGTVGIENGDLATASQHLTHALAGDPATGVPGAIPGYRAALDSAGDYLRLHDAFDKGAKLITSPNVNEGDFADVFNGLDAPSQEAFKGGFANKIYDLAQNGRLNASTFKAPRVQQKVQTVLGPADADSFLGKIAMEGQLAQTGSRMAPGNGSQTFELGNAAGEHDGPNLLSVLHGLHNPLGMLKNFAEMGATSGTTPQVRDEMGRLLMQPPSASYPELNLTPYTPPSRLLGAAYYPALSGAVAQNTN